MFLCARGVFVVSYGDRRNGTWCGSHPYFIYPAPNKLGSVFFACIPNPIKTNVYGFRSVLFDGLVDDV